MTWIVEGSCDNFDSFLTPGKKNNWNGKVEDAVSFDGWSRLQILGIIQKYKAWVNSILVFEQWTLNLKFYLLDIRPFFP